MASNVGANLFATLPDELLLHIFEWMDVITLLTSCRVCRMFRTIGATKQLWKGQFFIQEKDKALVEGLHPAHLWWAYPFSSFSKANCSSSKRREDAFSAFTVSLKRRNGTVQCHDDLVKEAANNILFLADLLTLLPEGARTRPDSVRIFVQEIYHGTHGMKPKHARYMINYKDCTITNAYILVGLFRDSRVVFNADESAKFAYDFSMTPACGHKLIQLAMRHGSIGKEVLDAYSLVGGCNDDDQATEAVERVAFLVEAGLLPSGVIVPYAAHLKNTRRWLDSVEATWLANTLNTLAVPARTIFSAAPFLSESALSMIAGKVLCEPAYIDRLVSSGTMSTDSVSVFATALMRTGPTFSQFAQNMNCVKKILDKMAMRPDTLLSELTLARLYGTKPQSILVDTLAAIERNCEGEECVMMDKLELELELEWVACKHLQQNPEFLKLLNLKPELLNFTWLVVETYKERQELLEIKHYRSACCVVCDSVLYDNEFAPHPFPKEYDTEETARLLSKKRKKFAIQGSYDLWDSDQEEH